MFKSFEEKNLPGIPAARFARRVATVAFASAVAAMAVLPLTANANFDDEDWIDTSPVIIGGDASDQIEKDRDNSSVETAENETSPLPSGKFVDNEGVINIPHVIIVGDESEQTDKTPDNTSVETTGNATKKEDPTLGDDLSHKTEAEDTEDVAGESTPGGIEDTEDKSSWRVYEGPTVASVPKDEKVVVLNPPVEEGFVLNSAVPQSVVESASMLIDGIQGHSERLWTKANHLWIDGVASYSHGRDDAYGAYGHYKNGFKSRKAGFVAGYDVDLRDDLVAGAAVSWIRSKYNSKGFMPVENKADTYGIALYSDWQATDKLKLGALAGWQRTKGKIRMDLPEGLLTGASAGLDPAHRIHAESRARTNAFVGSLRAAYDVPVDALTVTPHVGLDLIHAKTRPMDVKVDGKVAGKADFKSHTTWELPLGVRFSSVLDKNGWLIKPEADLTYTAVFGDRRMKFDWTPADQSTGKISSHDVEFINSNRIGAAVGVSFDNKRDKLFGLHYKVERSDNGLDHQFKLEFVKRF